MKGMDCYCNKKKQLVFLWDFIFHSCFNESTYHSFLFKLFVPLIREVTFDLDFIEFKDKKNHNGELFNRDLFFLLSGISSVKDSYSAIPLNRISRESINYFLSFLDKGSIIFGVELGLEIRTLLTKHGVTYINLWLHPWKLFDDIPLLFGTNNKEIWEKLKNYQVPQVKFIFNAEYYKQLSIRRNDIEKVKDIESNSCLFVGQCNEDKSIEYNGHFLSILDFKEELKELSKKYSKIYYLPHPFYKNNKDVEDFISHTDYLIKIENIPTYLLLMTEKIDLVCSISSSVLYEANYFGKKTKYLFHPLFDIDGEYSINCFVSILNDYFNLKFWKDIFSPILKTQHLDKDFYIFNSSRNKLRDLTAYYGYKDFDLLKRSESYLLSEINRQELLTNKKYDFLFNSIYSIKELMLRRDSLGKLGNYDDVDNIVESNEIFHKEKKDRNFSFDSGERQIAAELDLIRADHINRYKFSVNSINNFFSKKNRKLIGADIFCGNGYGAKILSENVSCSSILAVDGSSEAIEFAKKHYSDMDGIINYKHFLFPFELKRNHFDFIVSLESIEHIVNDQEFIHTIWHALKHQGLLIISTPDEEFQPYETISNPFHVRHYSFDSFILKMESLHFKLLNFGGQNVYKLNSRMQIESLLDESQMGIKISQRGQFNIYSFMLDL